VDNFGVKYVGKEHADHLIRTLKKHYKIATDWDGDLYCGIKLDWHYNQGYLDISMPGYVKCLLDKFKHNNPEKPQYSPYQAAPRIYGKGTHNPLPDNTTKKLDKKRIKRIQQAVGGI
jgi:hypothetical protein